MSESVADLASWLTAVWDEEEQLATEAADRDGVFSPHWTPVDIPYEGIYFYAGPEDGGIESAVTRHIGVHDPASVLARIAADRKILAEHRAEEIVSIEPETRGRAFLVCRRCRTGERQLVWPCTTVRLLAEPYADLEGFRSEWLVERQGVER